MDASAIATDSEIGRVYNLLFADQSWTIRYVVVDVRSWLSRHDVLIAVADLDQPDWTKRTFQVRLTKEQVRHRPDVDSKKPVCRQQEIAMKEYTDGPPIGRRAMRSSLQFHFPRSDENSQCILRKTRT